MTTGSERTYSTRAAARLIGVKPSRLQSAVWDDRVPAPDKDDAGRYAWTADNVARASWALLRRPLASNAFDSEGGKR